VSIPTKVDFPQACRMFFGQRDGQDLVRFVGEVNRLPPQDREEMRRMLEIALNVEVVDDRLVRRTR
jgi:hypothetical protein